MMVVTPLRNCGSTFNDIPSTAPLLVKIVMIFLYQSFARYVSCFRKSCSKVAIKSSRSRENSLNLKNKQRCQIPYEFPSRCYTIIIIIIIAQLYTFSYIIIIQIKYILSNKYALLVRLCVNHRIWSLTFCEI